MVLISNKVGFVGDSSCSIPGGRPRHHPAVLRPPQSGSVDYPRNIELIWLTGQLAPDIKTIADLSKDNGKAIREVCREFVAPCRKLDVSVRQHSRKHRFIFWFGSGKEGGHRIRPLRGLRAPTAARANFELVPPRPRIPNLAKPEAGLLDRPAFDDRHGLLCHRASVLIRNDPLGGCWLRAKSSFASPARPRKHDSRPARFRNA
jgi:hypothetical protein